MKTTVTTFQNNVTGDRLSVSTQYGIIKYTNLGRFINKINEHGYELTTAQFEALMSFFRTGENEGWIDKIMYAMPFIGNSRAYKAAAVPLIDRFAAHRELRIARSGYDLDYDNDYSKYFTINGSGNILATKPYRTDMALIMNLSVYDLFTKAECSENRNNGNYGFTWYGMVTTPGELVRIYQTESEQSNIAGFTTAGNFYTKLFGREHNNPTTGSSFFNGEAHYYSSNDKPKSNNILQWRTSNGDLTSLLNSTESADRNSYNVLPDSELEKASLLGLHCSWNSSNNSVLRVSLNSGLETRFMAFTDGTMTNDYEVGYRAALRSLLQSFGKRY